MKTFVLRSILVSLMAISSLILLGCNENIVSDPKASPSGQVESEEVFEWKLAMTWPTNFPIFGDAVNRFSEKVKVMSQGKLLIEIDSASLHKAPLGVLDMVKAGQYEMGHSASYYWKGKDPSTMFFTTMPFGMTAPEQYAWFYYGGGLDLMQKIYAKHGVYSFPGGNTGVQMGGWFRNEISNLDDLKGLKMRIPGFAGEILSKLGVVVTNIPPGELYTALERGTIDALEWVGPALDLNMGFQKIAPYYYTGWHEPAAELQFLVNKQAFDQLPTYLQEIVVTTMKAETLDSYARMYHDNAFNFDTISKDYPDVQIQSFSPEIIAAMKKINDQLLEKTAAEDPQFKEILESQRIYLAKSRAWSMISDYAYLRDSQAQ